MSDTHDNLNLTYNNCDTSNTSEGQSNLPNESLPSSKQSSPPKVSRDSSQGKYNCRFVRMASISDISAIQLNKRLIIPKLQIGLKMIKSQKQLPETVVQLELSTELVIQLGLAMSSIWQECKKKVRNS